MSSIGLATLGDFVANRYGVRAYCVGRDCSHSSELDLSALADWLGSDFDFYANDLRPRMRCTACGGLGATFIIGPENPDAGRAHTSTQPASSSDPAPFLRRTRPYKRRAAETPDLS